MILRRDAIVLVYGWWGVIGLDECKGLIVELTRVELYELAALVNRYGDLLRWRDVSVMILACISGFIDPIVIVDMYSFFDGIFTFVLWVKWSFSNSLPIVPSSANIFDFISSRAKAFDELFSKVFLLLALCSYFLLLLEVLFRDVSPCRSLPTSLWAREPSLEYICARE